MLNKNIHFVVKEFLLTTSLIAINALAQNSQAQQNCHVYFTNDSYILTHEAILVLNDLVFNISSSGPSLITIVGHSDRTGRATYNLKLSKRRAFAVDHFLKKSIKTANYRFQVSWQGEINPPFPTKDGVPEPYNRCVRVTLNKN
ncbi:OmpA family protein [Janthinobacterium sp. SUN098]|uniref:OmpA family protein n=1 Tax=Janthinobacterium sp. SUN098 TaxID=3002437 RepID=UPI0038D42A8E